MDDVFNNENESFQQETKLMENEYSVNLPTKFYYKGKWNNGWINIVNPFRATIVLGTPGSSKSYAIVNNYIKQQIEKGFSMYIYDFKFDDAYNHLLKHREKYKIRLSSSNPLRCRINGTKLQWRIKENEIISQRSIVHLSKLFHHYYTDDNEQHTQYTPDADRLRLCTQYLKMFHQHRD